MFGYVKAHKNELRIKEYDAYCAAYCGLCRAMKQTTGTLSCLVLNYDFVFLCLVRSALEGEIPIVSYHRCPVHPLKKRPMLEQTRTLEYSAKASAMLTFGKAQDDIRDSNGTKKALYRLIFPFFKYLNKRADLPLLESAMTERLAELHRIEKSKTASLDAPAGVFGELLGEVFAYGLEGVAHTLAYKIGYHTGKFVYAADAADDYGSDLKDGSYNPLCELYGADFGEEKRMSMKTALLCELSELEAAVSLVDFSSCPDYGEIVKNIIYIGMPEVMTRALFKESASKGFRKDVNKK